MLVGWVINLSSVVVVNVVFVLREDLFRWVIMIKRINVRIGENMFRVFVGVVSRRIWCFVYRRVYILFVLYVIII